MRSTGDVIAFEGKKWVVETEQGDWIRATAVVMASGGFNIPKPAPFPTEGLAARGVQVMHSSDYKNPTDSIRAGPDTAVLVVGTGQSGTQIVADIAEAGDHRVYAAVGRRSLRIPRKVRGKDCTVWMNEIGDFDKLYSSLTATEQRTKRFGPNPSQMGARDVRLRELVRDTPCTLVGKVTRFDDASGEFVFDGAGLPISMQGIEAFPDVFRAKVEAYLLQHPEAAVGLPVDTPEPRAPIPSCETHPLARLSIEQHNIKTVVLCHGYLLGFQQFFKEPFFFNKHLHSSSLLDEETRFPNLDPDCCGAAVDYPGLFFLGMHWMYKWKSAIMLGCSEDAERVSAQVLTAIRSQRLQASATATAPNEGGSSRSRSSSISEEVPFPSSPNHGPAILRSYKGQLTSEEAARQSFESVVDCFPTGSNPAILSVDPTMAPVTYDDLHRFCRSKAVDLAAFGLGQGHRVCTVLPNGPESAVSFVALSQQCTLAPLNCQLPEVKFAFEFSDLPADAAVVMQGGPAFVTERVLKVAAAALPRPVPVLELVPDGVTAGLFTLRWHASSPRKLKPLDADDDRNRPPKREDVALVLHTSGTTKTPKIVPLRHRNIAVGALCIASTLQLTTTDICMNVQPLFHIHGQVINVLASLVSGAAVLATPGFGHGTKAVFEWLDRCRPTWYSAVPTIHFKILQHGQAVAAENGGKKPKHCLRLVRNCSAFLLPSIAKEIEEFFGALVLTTYAMTESMPLASNPRDMQDRRLDTVGFSGGPDVRVCRWDDGGAACDVGEHGEVCVRGDNVTSGYEYRAHMDGEDPNISAFYTVQEDDDAAGELETNGAPVKDADDARSGSPRETKWLRTGDKGYIDERGYLTLVGRYKEIINRGGEKISPFEVEDVLLSHPAISNLICFAWPHSSYGQTVGVALIPTVTGNCPSLRELREFCLGKITPQSVPEGILCVNMIPQGSTGKPDRIGLAKQFEASQRLPTLSETGDERRIWNAGSLDDVKDLDLFATPLSRVGSRRTSIVDAGAAGNDDAAVRSFSGESSVAAHPSDCAAIPRCVSESADGGAMFDERAIFASSNTAYGRRILPELSLVGIKNALELILIAALQDEVSKILHGHSIMPDAPLVEVGFDSLQNVRLAQTLQDKLGVEIPLPMFAEGLSVNGIARFVANSVSFAPQQLLSLQPQQPHNGEQQERSVADPDGVAAVDAAPHTPADALFDLVPMQAAYWVGRRQGRGSWLAWEIVIAEFDSNRFESAVRQLVERHGMLRAVVLPDGKQQRILPVNPDQLWSLHVVAPETPRDLPNLIASARDNATRGFDSMPLWLIEAVVLNDETKQFRLFFSFDLLIVDATALNVLTKELEILYTGSGGLSATAPQYSQHVARKHRQAARWPSEVAREDAYWGARADAFGADSGGGEQVAAAPAVAGGSPAHAGAAAATQTRLPPHGLPACPQLPMAASRGGVSTSSSATGLIREEDRIAPADYAQLKERCSRFGVTVNSCLLAAYATVIGTFSSKQHFTLSVACSTRAAEMADMVGNCMDIILIEFDLRHGPPSLLNLAKSAQAETAVASQHSKHTSGIDVMRRLNVRDKTPGRAPSPYVFASALGLPSGSGSSGGGGGGGSDTTGMFNWCGHVNVEQTALSTPQVLLDHQVFADRDGSLHLNFDYDAVELAEGLAGQMLTEYKMLVEKMARSDAVWKGKLPLLVPHAQLAVRDAIMHADDAWGAELRKRHGLLHAPALRQARQEGGRPAVIVMGNSANEFTYQSLAQLVHIYAQKLDALGSSSAPVGILAGKGVTQVIAVLATLQSGRAYVPLSTNWPRLRLDTVAESVGMKVCFVSAADAEGTPDMPSSVTTIRVSTDELESSLHTTAAPDLASADSCPARPNDTAYIIFSSGSTGKPKGIEIPHRGASNTCLDINERYQVGPDDAVLCLADLTFDLSVWDIFGVLGAGGTLVMPDDRYKLEAAHWLDALEQHQVTVWNTAPPMMAMLIEHVSNSPGALARFRTLPLRLVMLSGDYVQMTIPPFLYEYLPNVRVVNLGGATEASIWSCHFDARDNPFAKPDEDVFFSRAPIRYSSFTLKWCKFQCWNNLSVHCSREVPRKLDPDWAALPYGSGLTNQRLYVLDANQRPVPDGVVGTISISGDGLAKGYWGTSDETLAKTGKTFPYSDHLGLRLCQPGDLGRYYADGIIEFLGREDFQVKIKGYRVEVAEVQKACEASTLVKLAFVIPVGPNGRKLLCAFILPDDDNSTEEMLRVDVERACKELVPWYMKPTFIHRIDDEGLSKLLSANQKMDRTKMEARHNEIAKTGGSAASADGFRDNTVATPPRSDAERKMLQLWKDVLPDGCGGTLGIYDHFFELGGDSMSGSGLVGRVNAAFGTTMLLQEILSWDNMCIASLTSHVTGTVSDVGGAEGDLPDGVTALKSCTGRPPLFLIAPVSGNSHCYRMLARELPTDQPVYGLSCPGLDSPDIELSTLIHEWTIPSLAAHFIGLIQEVLTIRHGRSCHFSLGGWSFGGVVAFELSRILPADLKCLALCMIDSPGPIGPPSRPPVDSHGRQQQQQQQQVGSGASDSIAMLLAFELDYQLSRDSGAMPNPGDDDGGDEKVAAFPAGISTERARTIVLQRLQQARVIPMDFTHQQFKRMVEVYAANLEALQCFRPTPEAVKECPPRSQRGEVYLFRAINTNQHLVQGYAGAPALDFGWLKVGLPASSVRVRLYDGDHFAVCQSAGVPMIKMFLQGALEIRARAFTRTLVETSNARVKRQHFERQRSSQGDFQMGAGSSSDQDAHHAADEAMAQLRKALFPVWPPDLIVVAVSTSTYNPDTLLAILRDTALTGGCALHVCSSLFGGFSEEGLKPLCLLGFVDHAGTFGTGWAGLPADAGVCTAELARSAGVAATMAASAAKNAVGGGVGQPSLAIVTPGVQGFEEDILAGIRSMLPGVPICGGTAADDGLLDDAKRFVAGSRDARVSFSPDSAAAGPNDGGPAAVHSAALQRGVVVSLLWPSVPTSVLFSSAYNPMETASGTVTKASGRILHEIGGKPAAQVYARWSRSADIAAAVADQGTRPAPILAGSTLHPLAKIVRGPAAEKRNAHDHHSTRLSAGGFSAQKTEVDFHSLIHPKAVLAGDSLELFATLEEGDTICCLEATVDELDRHTEEVLGLNAGSEDGNGALLVYCGGCALALKTEARLAGVARRLRAALRNQPFMGLVTYGEQGIDPYGNAQHANLMYAIVRFGVKPSASANHV